VACDLSRLFVGTVTVTVTITVVVVVVVVAAGGQPA
jgi:hypothetical protein